MSLKTLLLTVLGGTRLKVQNTLTGDVLFEGAYRQQVITKTAAHVEYVYVAGDVLHVEVLL